jgi:tetratricopeptide (TPR) repeat protein
MAKDYREVIRLAGLGEYAWQSMQETLYLIGRSAFLAEEYEVALTWLSRAAHFDEDNHQILLLIARSAMKVDEYGIAFDAYCRIRDAATSSDEDNAQQREMAAQQLFRVCALATAKARELMGQEQFFLAWELAGISLKIDAEFEKAILTREAIVRGVRRQVLDPSDYDYSRLEAADNLLFVDPESSVGFKVRALELSRMGEYRLAIDAWDRYLDIVGESPAAQMQIEKCKRALAS